MASSKLREKTCIKEQEQAPAAETKGLVTPIVAPIERIENADELRIRPTISQKGVNLSALDALTEHRGNAGFQAT